MRSRHLPGDDAAKAPADEDRRFVGSGGDSFEGGKELFDRCFDILAVPSESPAVGLVSDCGQVAPQWIHDRVGRAEAREQDDLARRGCTAGEERRLGEESEGLQGGTQFAESSR